MEANSSTHLCACAYEHHGVCCLDRSREKKTDGTGKDVCLAGEVNKIEAVL